MDMGWQFWRSLALAVVVVLTVGIPTVGYVAHGLDQRFWPTGAFGFGTWLGAPLEGGWRGLFDMGRVVWSMAVEDDFPDLPGRGNEVGAALAAVTMLLTVWWSPTPRVEPERDRSDVLGGADWASEAETKRLNRGLELGTDPCTERVVRVPIEGNLLTVAPPRSGKSMGLIVPNLVAPDPESWDGPAVVFDPKGELHRIVGRRRREIAECHGRRVLCLDPFGIAGGTDRWNPLDGIDANATGAFLALAGGLVVDPGEQNQYFRRRAIGLVAGLLSAMVEADVGRTLAGASDLLSDLPRLEGLAKASRTRAGRRLSGLLALAPGTRDPLLSSAETAFEWLLDEVMEASTSASTFAMRDVARGDADLFLCLPADRMEEQAPWLRMVLMDLMRAARRERRPGDPRVVAFVDEAASLGRFGELRRAVGELPGSGLSLWTFWQSRGQIESLHDRGGAKTFRDAAAVWTAQNVPPGEEAEAWSRMLGNYTAPVRSRGTGERAGQDTVSPQAVPLLAASAVAELPHETILAFLRGDGATRRPLKLTRANPHQERRFAGLLDADEERPPRIG